MVVGSRVVGPVLAVLPRWRLWRCCDWLNALATNAWLKRVTFFLYEKMNKKGAPVGFVSTALPVFGLWQCWP